VVGEACGTRCATIAYGRRTRRLVRRDGRSGRKRLLSALAGRSARRGKGLLIAIAILLAFLPVLDRVGVVLAQSVAAGAVQRHYKLDRKPSVRVHGFPFLTQVISRHYDDVGFAAHDLSVGSGDRMVDVQDVNARFSDIHTTGNFSSARAEKASGTALIGYAALGRILGGTVTYAGPGADGKGRITASRTVTALGQSVTGKVTCGITVASPTSIGFTKPTVDLAGANVPPAITDALASTFQLPLDLSGIPGELRLESLTLAADGVHLAASGINVQLRQP